MTTHSFVIFSLPCFHFPHKCRPDYATSNITLQTRYVVKKSGLCGLTVLVQAQETTSWRLLCWENLRVV